MIEVLAREGRPWRIGHRGAAALAPGNTLAALERAVAEGVHAVEFDVLDLADGTLVLAHSDDLEDVTHGVAHGPVRGLGIAGLRDVFPAVVTLDEALGFFAGTPEVGLHVDLKLPGYEAPVVEALRERGLADRTMISTGFHDSLAVVRSLEPRIRLGLAYPLDRHHLSRRRLLAPALLPAVVAMRAALPYRMGSWVERTGASVLALNWLVVSRAAVRRAHAHGVAVWAWTVDGGRADSIAALGVDGLIGNDPRPRPVP
jgi:glycerophosphoryl diester phosphodiesterase